MRTVLAALLASLLIAVSVVRPVAAGELGESIRAVIESQLAAFQRNDLGAAFAHASPGIQAIFGTPEAFGRMVEIGYPMVWRPARYRMLDLAETAGGTVQIVLFEDGAGRQHEAAYLMVEIGGVWRIAGVRLSTLPGVGA